MTAATPPACTLEPDALGQRLAAISAIGRDSLISHENDGNTHLLHFRRDTKTRRQLEQIVAAERGCCSFLDLSVRENRETLTLSIAAPETAREIASGLASLFSSAVS